MLSAHLQAPAERRARRHRAGGRAGPGAAARALRRRAAQAGLHQPGAERLPGHAAAAARLTRHHHAWRATSWPSGGRAPRRPDQVEIRFRDTGPGIPDEARERIFVPFYTTKEKGTGLGLAICQRIVKAHQGTLVVRSPPGGGAEFIVSLPGLREERPELEPRPPTRSGQQARERRRARAEARLRKRKRRRRA